MFGCYVKVRGSPKSVWLNNYSCGSDDTDWHQNSVSTRTVQVSLHAFTTLDISAVLTHYGWTFTPFKQNPSVAQQRKPSRCMCEETLRLQHSGKLVEICQSTGFSPSSFVAIRGLCDRNTVYRMGLRNSHETDNRILFPLETVSSIGTHTHDCLYTSVS